MRKKRMRKFLSDEIGFLVFQNVENLRWVTLQNLNQAFRRFSLDLEAGLPNTLTATNGAVRKALKKRMEQSHTVADELRRYEGVRENLERSMKLFSPE
jgi:hypothetical protein